MTRDIKALAKKYPELITYKSIGKTHYGRELWAVKLGTGNTNVFINGAHHAREWLTTNLNMYMIEQYAKAYTANQVLGGYKAQEILQKTSIWFVPMVNPDGVTLQQLGVTAFPKQDQSKLIAMNGGSRNFKRWKANGQGIDLNRHYPAGWDTISHSPSSASWKNYKGKKAAEALETQAIMNFTYEIDPEMVIAYHTAGEVLYWSPYNNKRDQEIARKIHSYTGYPIIRTTTYPSGGVYTDWFFQEFDRPSFNPEIGTFPGETNVSISQFDKVWRQNKYIGLYAAEKAQDLSLLRHKVEPVNYSITLLNSTKLYKYPNQKFISSIGPQTVQATAKKGNWYQISTWLGSVWIEGSRAVINEPEIEVPEIEVPEVEKPETEEPEVLVPEDEPKVEDTEGAKPEPEVIEAEVIGVEVKEPEVKEPEVKEPEVINPAS